MKNRPRSIRGLFRFRDSRAKKKAVTFCYGKVSILSTGGAFLPPGAASDKQCFC